MPILGVLEEKVRTLSRPYPRPLSFDTNQASQTCPFSFLYDNKFENDMNLYDNIPSNSPPPPNGSPGLIPRKPGLISIIFKILNSSWHHFRFFTGGLMPLAALVGNRAGGYQWRRV